MEGVKYYLIWPYIINELPLSRYFYTSKHCTLRVECTMLCSKVYHLDTGLAVDDLCQVFKWIPFFGRHLAFNHLNSEHSGPVYEYLLENWTKRALKPSYQAIVSSIQMAGPFKYQTQIV